MEFTSTTHAPVCSSLDAFIPTRYRFSSYGVSASSSSIAVITYNNTETDTTWNNMNGEKKENLQNSRSFINNTMENNTCGNRFHTYSNNTSSVHYENLFKFRNLRTGSDYSQKVNNFSGTKHIDKSKHNMDLLSNKTIQTMRNYVLSHQIQISGDTLKEERKCNNFASEPDYGKSNTNVNAKFFFSSTQAINREPLVANTNNMNTFSAAPAATLADNLAYNETSNTNINKTSDNIKNGLIATLTGSPPTEHNKIAEDADTQQTRLEKALQLRLHDNKCDASKMYSLRSMSLLLEESNEDRQSRSNDNTVSSVIESNVNSVTAYNTALAHSEKREWISYSEAILLLVKMITVIKTSRTKPNRAFFDCITTIDISETKLGTVSDFCEYLEKVEALSVHNDEINTQLTSVQKSKNNEHYRNTIENRQEMSLKHIDNSHFIPHRVMSDSLSSNNCPTNKYEIELALLSVELWKEIAFPDVNLPLLPQEITRSQTSKNSKSMLQKLVFKKSSNSSNLKNSNNNSSSAVLNRSLCLGLICTLLFTPGDLRYRVTELICVNCALNDNDVYALSLILRMKQSKNTSCHLTTIDLSNNIITNIGASYLKKAIKQNDNIIALKLNGNDGITEKYILTSIEKRLEKNRGKKVSTKSDKSKKSS